MKPWARRRRKDKAWVEKNGVWQRKVSEEDVLEEIVSRLWFQVKIKVWRVRERIPGMCSPKNLSTPGIPDLIGFIPRNTLRVSEWTNVTVEHHGLPAQPLFIEVKRPGGARRPAQEAFIAEALAGGCCAFFAESWEDVVAELKKVGIRA